MKKLFSKKGGSEIVSLVLAIVIIGGLSLAVAGGFASNTKNKFGEGLNEQNVKLDKELTNASENVVAGENQPQPSK